MINQGKNNPKKQIDIIRLARQGNVDAINSLLRSQLRRIGITATISEADGILKIIAESKSQPIQKSLVSHIQNTLSNSLKVKNIKSVLIYGKQVNRSSYSWTEKIDLDSYNPSEQLNKPNSNNKIKISDSFADNTTSEIIDTNTTVMSTASTDTRKAYQFIQIRVQLLGRGMTNEIMNLYVNGKRLKPKIRTLHEFLNYLGAQGFQVVTAEMEIEGVYTHFYTLQREVLTQQPPDGDIFDELARAKEGADFGDAVKNFLEGGLDRLA